MHLRLKDSSRAELLDYVAAQLGGLYPDGKGDVRCALERDIDETLDRLRVGINAVRMWREDEFDYLHSEQNTHFLYFLANTIWRNREDRNVCTKLFYLNKTLNGFSCFYDNELPDRFLVGHSVGIVLVRANYPSNSRVYESRAGSGRAPTGSERPTANRSPDPGRSIGCRAPPRGRMAPTSDRRPRSRHPASESRGQSRRV